MPEYLYTARSPDGRKATERIEADSADEVMKSLNEHGYSEVVLHTDDVGAVYTNVAEHISPREYIGFRHIGGFGYLLYLTRKCYLSSWKFYLFFGLLLGFRRYLDLPWDFVDYLALVALAVPILIASCGEWFGAPRKYNRLMENLSWGRCDEVLELIPKLRGKLPPQEAARYEAQVLARLGRIDQGIKLFQQFADDKQIPEWLYWSLQAGIYHVAKEYDQFLEAMEKAAALAPYNVTILLDLAVGLIQYKQDVQRAAELISKAKSHAISDIMSGFLEMAEGMLDLERKDAYEAKHFLELSLISMARFREASPLMNAVIDQIHTYLALVYAALGDRATASKHFRRAEPRLRALRMDDLLERCKKAIENC